ncbi:BadF/BadG/BcrA/BcrD ATPase family protein, partial [Escherichia coli]
GLGARFLEPATRAVIDIGGKDSKVIKLDDDGNLCDFLMNDKCAGGTGRFLEGVSRPRGTSVVHLESISEIVTPDAST